MRTTAFCCALFAAAALAASCSAANPRYVQVIRSVFGKDAPTMICIVGVETQNDPWNPWAWSPTEDAGIFQINYLAHHWRGESKSAFRRRMADVRYAARYAHGLMLADRGRGGSGWRPWTTRWRCI